VIPDDEFGLGGCCFYLRFGAGDRDVFFFCSRCVSRGACDFVWSWSLLLWLVGRGFGAWIFKFFGARVVAIQLSIESVRFRAQLGDFPLAPIQAVGFYRQIFH
jgi:hypothetical protein